MTTQDIKKALMTCSVDSCKDCPYDNTGLYCCGKLKRDALVLITEQENEIERLRTTLGQCNTELNSALESLKSQCCEIGELKAGTKQAKIVVLNTARERCDLVAEELEDEIDHYGSSAAYSCAYEIKKLIKEVENEQKD